MLLKRLKVKRLVKEQIIPSRRKYKTTYKDIRIWFNYLNDVVFDSKLTPFNDIQIKKIYDKSINKTTTFTIGPQ